MTKGHESAKLHLISKNPSAVGPPPGDEVSADVEEDEEALIVRREGSVSAQAPPLLPQTLQVNDMQVDLLSDGRG